VSSYIIGTLLFDFSRSPGYFVFALFFLSIVLQAFANVPFENVPLNVLEVRFASGMKTLGCIEGISSPRF